MSRSRNDKGWKRRYYPNIVKRIESRRYRAKVRTAMVKMRFDDLSVCVNNATRWDEWSWD